MPHNSSRRSNPSCGRICPRDEWECVVVSDNSTDDTEARFAAFAAAHPGCGLRLVAEEGPGVSYARNRGLREAQAPLVAFIDDDERVNEGFLRAYLEFFETRPGAVVAGGRIVAEYPAGRPAWMSKYVEMPIANPMDFGERVRPFPAGRVPGGGNMAFRRAGLASYGGFDPTLGRVNGELIGGEENDFFERLLLGGETMLVCAGGGDVAHHSAGETAPGPISGALSYNVGVSQRLRAEIHRRLSEDASCWRSPEMGRRRCVLSLHDAAPQIAVAAAHASVKSAGGCSRKLKIRSCRLWSHAISPSRGRDLGWGRIVNTANAGRQRILRKKIGCDSGMRCCFKYKGLNICSALCI